MPEKIKIKVFAFYQDGGDGGGTTWLYNSKEEYVKERVDKYTTQEKAEEDWEKALSGDSPYEDGEISEETIILERVDGKWRLGKEGKYGISFHWGQ